MFIKSLRVFFAVAACMTLFAVSLSAQEDLLKKNWAKFDRYSNANETYKAENSARPAAVLYGDSITDAWPRQDPDFFKEHNFLGRGISGQTTSEMVVRFRQDVIDLNPKKVVILAGINDIACNNGAIPVEGIMGNIKSMCELAKLHHIKPILCTLTPTTTFPWRPQLGDVSATVDKVNDMIRAYANSNRIKLVDYAKVLTKDGQRYTKEYTKDDVHPNLAGYKAMEEALLKVIGK